MVKRYLNMLLSICLLAGIPIIADAQSEDQVIGRVVPLYYFRDAEKLLMTLRPKAKLVEVSKKTATEGTGSKAVAKSAEAGEELPQVLQDFLKGFGESSMLFAEAGAPGARAIDRPAIAAFQASSALFVVGHLPDVIAVENIIAAYDQPMPQAKIGLWTLQVNVVQDDSKVRSLNKAMILIEKELATTRERSAMAGSLLRDCLAEEVHRSIETSRSKFAGHVQSDKLAAFEFYEPEITKRLGFKPNDVQDPLNDARQTFLLRNLPDPGRPTTLGEAMLILVMAPRSTQQKVIDQWKARVAKYLLERDGRFKSDFGSSEQERIRKADIFPVTMRAFGLDGFAVHYKGLTPVQAEIVSALQRTTVLNIVEEMRSKERNLCNPELKLSADEKSAIKGALKVRYDFLQDEILLDSSQVKRILADPNNEHFIRFISQIPLASVNARVAAADDMLKKLIVAVEEDVDQMLILPSIQRIEKILRDNRINVGHFQRTNMLTSNRSESRVGTVTRADVSVGKTMDIKELGKFLIAAETNPIAALDQLQSTDTSSKFLVEGGDVFVLTPIFDPSGQALRYDLKYTNRRPVRGTGAGAEELPQITEYQLGTEIQLSTFELRTIASFMQDTELRIPEKRTGGIPVLNQLPILKEIPIIGWFSRRSGRSGVSQHSLIIGQTTIYPTIGDMLHLLLPPANRVVFGGG